MLIESAELHFLEIPFRLSLSHGAHAGRSSSDSIVLHITGRDCEGYGEAVVRDYVSGSLGHGLDPRQEAVRITAALLAPFMGHDVGWREAAAILADTTCEPRSLPLLCAVESAILACAVDEAGGDAYSVLGREPERTIVVYGGVLPFVPLGAARSFIEQCAQLELTNLKVKVGRDRSYNEAILGLCRQVLGDAFDITVDANAAWTAAEAGAQMQICAAHGVRVIEQPFPVSTAAEETLRAAKAGMTIMADEGVLTSADVRALSAAGTAQMLNLRLSKNGGLGRLLALALEAEACGLSYQLGCMVGETGILSCMGRLAASLLPKPVYVEGSYDDMLLQQNIVTPSFGFGRGGKAPIMRGHGMGYRVEKGILSKFSLACLPV